jgi:hypothetical protein
MAIITKIVFFISIPPHLHDAYKGDGPIPPSELTPQKGKNVVQFLHFFPILSFFLMAIATAEVSTPTFQAISAKGNPFSLVRR